MASHSASASDSMRVRPSAPALGVLAARRRLPHRGAARPRGRAEDAGARDYRARQHVLVDHLSRSGAQARHQPDSRLRSLRRARRPPDEERHARRNGESPGAPRRDARGLSQPHQARVVGIHRGLLLQAAHRQGAAGRALGRPHRPQQLPEGRGRDRHPHRAAGEGHARGGDLPRHPRARQFLPRDAVPGDRRPARRQHRPGADCPRPQPAARVHERRPLPEELGPPAARRPALHRHRQDRQRHRAAALSRRPVLLEDGAGNGGGLRRFSRGDGQHRAHRRALPRRPVRDGQLPAELRRPGRLHARRVLRARWSAKASSPACRG